MPEKSIGSFTRLFLYLFILTCKEQISKEPKPKINCAFPKQSDKVSKYFKVIGRTIWSSKNWDDMEESKSIPPQESYQKNRKS